MHLSFNILKSGVDEYLNALDIMALLIAAICHDIDHPGNSNNFEIASHSNLAILYSDDTVLERHHAATTIRLLDSCDFLAFLPSVDKVYLRKQVTSAIFGTDMSKHFAFVDKLNAQTLIDPPFDKCDTDSRQLLVKCVLHSADIGGQTQASSMARKWSIRCISEFDRQAKRELELGIEQTNYMSDLLTNELKSMQLQGNFITSIVLPLWSALIECFPKLRVHVEQLFQNKAFYATRVQRIEQALKESSSEANLNSMDWVSRFVE